MQWSKGSLGLKLKSIGESDSKSVGSANTQKQLVYQLCHNHRLTFAYFFVQRFQSFFLSLNIWVSLRRKPHPQKIVIHNPWLISTKTRYQSSSRNCHSQLTTRRYRFRISKEYNSRVINDLQSLVVECWKKNSKQKSNDRIPVRDIRCITFPTDLMWNILNQIIKDAEEPWSSGYGWRLMFQMLWVQIPTPYTGWTFFTLISCKNCIVCLKRPKINVKDAGVGSFF